MTWMPMREITLCRLSSQAELAKRERNLAEAERLYREIVEMTGKTFGCFDADYAQALENLAEVLEAQQLYSEALRLRERVTALRQPTEGKQPSRK